jgi:hypothetical protein
MTPTTFMPGRTAAPEPRSGLITEVILTTSVVPWARTLWVAPIRGPFRAAGVADRGRL